MSHATTMRSPRRLARSALAILAGFAAVVVLSMGTDEVMHATGVYPPKDQPMSDNGQYALALAYRLAFGILGSWVAARLAPHRPMTHALTVGGIGFALSLLGAVLTRNMELGPAWYSWALVVTALPAAWLGGRFFRGSAR
jgi:FtsH-binding integral membrane protein